MRGYAFAVASCLFALAACGDDGVTHSKDPSTAGPDCACRLDSKFPNLSVCVSPSTAFAPAHVYSTSWDAGTMQPSCDAYRDPQPAPTAVWTPVQINAGCAGTGKLCMTVKAGNASAVSPDDCVLASECTDIVYTTPKQTVDLAPLAGWSAESSDCANRESDLGAYLELSVMSEELGCGQGGAQVKRIPVCPAHCQTDPTGQGCEICTNGAILQSF